jgi:hypothetical protein
MQDASFIRRIPENLRKHLMGLLRLATAEMEPRQKKGKKSYFGYKNIKNATSIKALFAKLRLPRQRSMTAGLIC